MEKKLQHPSTLKLRTLSNSNIKRTEYNSTNKFLQIAENLSSALNNDDTSEANDLCGNLTAKLKRRNKLIKMADRSVLGWDTIAEYEADPITSNSDDEKHLTNLPFAFPVRNHQTSSFGSMVNITASHPRVNEISTLDFHRTVLHGTATIDAPNGSVA